MTTINDARLAGSDDAPMHGEYKMPGGKLVVADLQVRDGVLLRVQISGDFFLEPESALDRINAALIGLTEATDTDAIATVLRLRIGEDVSMYGVSPEAIALAVRRALEARR